MTGIELIAQERAQQIEKHGFTLSHDTEQYLTNELLQGALYCILYTGNNILYPAHWEVWFMNKMRAKEGRMGDLEFEIERLKIAGALIAARIDQVQMRINALD